MGRFRNNARYACSLAALAIAFVGGMARAAPDSAGQKPYQLGITAPESTQAFENEVSPRADSPNIIYIVLDDTGFSDIGAFGSEIATPNMDRLATDGLRYNNFRSKAICSPSRAALLTGRNSHSVGVSNVTNRVTGFPAGQGRIAPSAATIAEVLQSAGYRTYAVGKWHLNSAIQTSSRAQWPLGRGFDQFYGFLDGMTDQYNPDLIVDNTPVDRPKAANYHLSVDLVDHAISYIATETSVSPDRPFFLYLAFGATHAPHQVPRSYIDKYVPVFAKGWDSTRADRLAKQKRLGLAPDNAELAPPNPGIRPWTALSDQEKSVAVRFQAAYAGFLEHTDEQIGRLLTFLDESGRRDNTIIVLLSDNGGSKEGGLDGTLNEFQALTSGHDKPETMAARLDEFGQDSTSQNYPMGWAQASNTPFKDYKTSVWDGGVRTPLIINWPAHLKQTQRVRTQFVDIIDVTPTMLELAGLSMPDRYKGLDQLPVAGKSFADSFIDPAVKSPRDTQYFELMGQRGIWHDGWQAIATHKPGTSFEEDRWQLYNLGSDFSSVHDLSAEQPAMVAEMKSRWWAEAGKYGVMPLVDVQLAGAFVKDGGKAPSFAVKSRRTARSQYVLFPQGETLSIQETPVLKGKGYSFTVQTMPLAGNEQGVLIADGDGFGGYSFYIRNGELVFAFNDFGTLSTVRAPAAAFKGATEIRFRFQRQSPGAGIGQLLVDRKLLASGTISQTDSLRSALSGLDVGRDSGGHVVHDYADKGDFAFDPGLIRKVVVDVDRDEK